MDTGSLLLVKGLLFTSLLVIASIHDIRTREVPNWLSLALIGSGLLQLQLVPALIGLVSTGLPYLLAAVATNGKIAAVTSS